MQRSRINHESLPATCAFPNPNVSLEPDRSPDLGARVRHDLFRSVRQMSATGVSRQLNAALDFHRIRVSTYGFAVAPRLASSADASELIMEQLTSFTVSGPSEPPQMMANSFGSDAMLRRISVDAALDDFFNTASIATVIRSPHLILT